MNTQPEQLTLFPPGTRDHAKVKVMPGSEKARSMTDGSGRRLHESWMNSSPLGLLVKTCLGTSQWGSTRCLLTWKHSVTPQGRFIYQLSPSTPITNDIGYSLWPTPTKSQDYKRVRPLAPSERNGKHGKMLVGVVGDRFPGLIGTYLDPRFQESLMGFPENWTLVEQWPSETP